MMILQLRKTTVPERLHPSPSAARLSGHCGPDPWLCVPTSRWVCPCREESPPPRYESICRAHSSKLVGRRSSTAAAGAKNARLSDRVSSARR